MSDESESQAPLAAYPDHAAELQDIVQGIARLRRWSRFSVLWVIAACLCVFGAILFAGARSQDSEADEAMRNNARVSSCFAAVSRADELTARAVRAETEAAELRRENDELKRAAVSKRDLNVRLEVDQLRAVRAVRVPEVDHALGARTAAANRPTGDASSLSPEAVLSKIQSDYMEGIERCYREYLKNDASARGKVALSLTVNETGRTVKGVAHGFAAEVDECITGQMSTWRFPIPKDKDGDATDANFEIALELDPSAGAHARLARPAEADDLPMMR